MGKERPVDTSVGDALPLGSRIRLRRHARGVRLSDMAREIGYDRAYLSTVENNQASPSNELVGKIAEYLGTSAEALRQGPIARLGVATVAGGSGAGLHPFGLAHAALPSTSPALPAKRRTIGQRIERILAMAHPSEDEEEIVAKHLVAMTSELVSLVKAARQLR